MVFCTECGATVPDGVKFCTECGKVISETTQPAPTYNPPPVQPQPIYQSASNGDAPPLKGSKYAVMSTGSYIGHSILFSVPVVGWLICIITAFAAKNQNKRNYARAILIFLIIGIILSVVMYFVFSWVWQGAEDYMRDYISQ